MYDEEEHRAGAYAENASHQDANEEEGETVRWQLYSDLGVEPTATLDEIKRAYRKLALRYHPDKTSGDKSAEARFQQIQRAHEVLSDEDKRSAYDAYGEPMVELLEQDTLSPAMLRFLLILVNPKFSVALGLLSVVLFALMAVGPILIALQLDGSIEWYWSVVMIPVWALDVIGLFLLGLFTFVLWKAMKAADSDDESEDDETPLRAEAKATRDLTLWEMCDVCYPMAIALLFVSTQIMFALRLDFLMMNWIIVISPMFLAELIHAVFIPFRKYEYESSIQDGVEYFYCGVGYVGYLARLFYAPVCRVMFYVLLALSLQGVTGISWWVICTPLFWIIGVSAVCAVCDWRLQYRSPSGQEEEEEGARAALLVFLLIRIVCFSLLLVLSASFLFLAVGQLQYAAYSMFVVFIPLFIVIGCSCCACVCVCLPLVCVMQHKSGGWSKATRLPQSDVTSYFSDRLRLKSS